MYRLKTGQESFTPVEGPLAGRDFVPGKLYREIPPGTEGKFQKIPDEAPPQDPETARPARNAGKKGQNDAPENGEVK
jgi:hypothetical protein